MEKWFGKAPQDHSQHSRYSQTYHQKPGRCSACLPSTAVPSAPSPAISLTAAQPTQSPLPTLLPPAQIPSSNPTPFQRDAPPHTAVLNPSTRPHFKRSTLQLAATSTSQSVTLVIIAKSSLTEGGQNFDPPAVGSRLPSPRLPQPNNVTLLVVTLPQDLRDEKLRASPLSTFTQTVAWDIPSTRIEHGQNESSPSPYLSRATTSLACVRRDPLCAGIQGATDSNPAARRRPNGILSLPSAASLFHKDDSDNDNDAETLAASRIGGAHDDVDRWPAKENGMRGDGRLLMSHPPWRGLNEMRDELVEMQGRISELGREMAKVRDLTRYPIHHSTTCSDQFVLRDSRTDELLSLSYYGDLGRRNSVSPPFIPPLPLSNPCPTTVITSAVPNGRSDISLGLRSSRPRRGFTTSITFNEQLWIGSALPAGAGTVPCFNSIILYQKAAVSLIPECIETLEAQVSSNITNIGTPKTTGREVAQAVYRGAEGLCGQEIRQQVG
ncbi:hypothetical protein BGY98DRAFT_1178251 [Russula aff. rugulosa BPL654]|nr:hypothetical protein BGY98DRAFT_1178251 [Russula aff. rugulosa BPL654]